ncbi:TPA: hypothetical protein ACK1ZH_001987 [Enterobacter bugandensis]|jgi:hypothetical protein
MSIDGLHMEQQDFALNILFKTEVLETCQFHEDAIFDSGNEVENAYKYATALFKKAPENVPFSNLREMTDTIKDMYDQYSYGDGCPYCAKYMAE